MKPRNSPRTLDSIERIADPQIRGFAFQDFVSDLFASAGFDVTPNAGAARPRQTDLVARRGDEAYLIEVKWVANNLDVSHISDLHDRLVRTSSELTGVFLAYGDFGEGAIQDVQSRRVRPMLLFDETAIQELASSPGSLLRLLDLKRTLLVDKGTVHTGGSGRTRQSRQGLPESACTFPSDGVHASRFVSSGGFNGLVFASDLPDVDWVTSSGNGVVIDMGIAAYDIGELTGVLRDLLEMRWTKRPEYMSERPPAWSLHQTGTTWHGFGSKEFVAALKSWRARYREMKCSPHDSEEFVYVDRCRLGLFTLTGQISADSRRLVRHAILSFQLSGIPIDADVLRRLSRAFDSNAFFRTLSTPAIARRHFHRLDLTDDVIRALIVQSIDREDWVVGLVVVNPFQRAGVAWSKGRSSSSVDLEVQDPPWQLAESDVLVCDLNQWHPLDRELTSYQLRTVEWTNTSEATVVRAVGDWHDKSRRDPWIELTPEPLTKH